MNPEVPAVMECISWLGGGAGHRKTNKEMNHLLLGGGEPHQERESGKGTEWDELQL